MQVNDKNMIYEISKQLPRPAQNSAEKSVDRPLDDQNKGHGEDQAGQDAIVDFSDELQTVKTIKEAIASQPDVREDMVARLKSRIESGKYRMDHKAIADRLVDFYLEENL